MKVIGVRKYDYTSKRTNNTMKAVNLYVTYPGTPEKGYKGEICERLFCAESALQGYLPMLGDTIEVFYNKYGNIEKVAPKK